MRIEVGSIRALPFAVLALALASPASASGLELEQVGGANFTRPTFVASDPQDAERLFVVEQDGRIKLIEDGGEPQELLDINGLVLSPEDGGGNNERGLFAIAFAPDYGDSGRFYISYTIQGGAQNGALRVDELVDTGEVPLDPASLREVLTIQQPQANHNGGQLQLGPDAYLYLSTGDGGGGGDPGDNAQDLTNLLGAILRIDPAGAGDGDYAVPVDNPFAGTPGCDDGCDEIWSYGLRNPWRFSFDRHSGALTIGDVGEGSWEEIDYAPAPSIGRGANFGWDCREGMHEYTGPEAPGPGSPSALCPGRAGTFTEPVFEYPRPGFPNECSVTGGYVVRDESLGGLEGRYLYADFCVGELRSLILGLPLASRDCPTGLPAQPNLTTFGEDAEGRIYVARQSGQVYRLTGEWTAPEGCAAYDPDPSPNPDPGASPGSDPPAEPGPRLTLRFKQGHRLKPGRRIAVRVTADRAADVSARPRPRGAARGKLRLRTRTRFLDAGATARFAWKPGRRAVKGVRGALKRGKRAALGIRFRAVAAGGEAVRERLRIRLVR